MRNSLEFNMGMFILEKQFISGSWENSIPSQIHWLFSTILFFLSECIWSPPHLKSYGHVQLSICLYLVIQSTYSCNHPCKTCYGSERLISYGLVSLGKKNIEVIYISISLSYLALGYYKSILYQSQLYFEVHIYSQEILFI